MAHFRFGGGATGTVLHPLVAIGILLAMVLIFSRPRDEAITPFLLVFFSIPVGQVVVLGGVHFTAHQILILAVLARMASFRGSFSDCKYTAGFKALDTVVVLWSLSELIMFFLQWMETQALVKGLGDLVLNL